MIKTSDNFFFFFLNSVSKVLVNQVWNDIFLFETTYILPPILFLLLFIHSPFLLLFYR